MSENFIIINTPERTVLWSRHKMVIPDNTCYLLNERVSKKIIDIVNQIPCVHQVTFNSEYINKYISNCSTQQRHIDFVLLQMELHNYKREGSDKLERIHSGNSLWS